MHIIYGTIINSEFLLTITMFTLLLIKRLYCKKYNGSRFKLRAVAAAKNSIITAAVQEFGVDKTINARFV